MPRRPAPPPAPPPPGRARRRATAAQGERRRGSPSAPWLGLHGAPAVGEREARLATRLAWVLALVMAAALTAVALGPHRIGDYSTETDFYGAYADGARGIQKGHLDPGRYGVVGPGYEVALALVGALAPDLFAAAETISILATVTTLLLWFHLLRRRADARLALLAALFMAVNPHFFRFGYTASTDALALSLQAAALFLLLAMPGWRTAAVAGVVAAAAFLTRYSAVVLLPVGLLAAAGGGRPVRRGAAGVAAPRASSRRADTVAFAAGFLLPVAAWVAYGLSQGGGAPSQLHHNLAFEVFARARGIPWDVYQRDLQPRFTSLRDVIAYDPAAVGLRLAINSVDHLREDARLLLGWPTAACVALGALLAARGGALRRQWPLALAAGLSFAAFVPAFHSERYSLALLPYYAASAAALFASPRWALVLGSRVWLKPALAAVPLGLALAGSLDLQRRILAQQPTEALACAQTLRSLAAPGDRVLVRKPHVAYLAGVESVAFPFADSLPQLAAYARRHGARWMLIGLGEIEMRPAFRYLLDTSGVVPGLTPRRVTGPRPAVLYQIGPEFGEIPAWFDNDTLAALHDARAAAMAFPLEAGHLRRAGTIELARGEFVAAREHLERAADLAPSDPEVLLPLGEALMRTGALELAGIAYARAEQAAPGNVQARIGRGWVSLLGGRPREAAELWRPVVRVTDSPATLEQMLALYRSLGDREAAAAAEARLRQRGR